MLDERVRETEWRRGWRSSSDGDSEPANPQPECPWETECSRGADRAWFEALFRAHYAKLASFVFRYVGSREAAEDVVQDLLFAVWDNRERWRAAEHALPAMLYTAARNRALNALKHRGIGERCYMQLARGERGSAGAGDLVQYNELRAAVGQAVEGLPQRCHLIFTLSREQGLTYGEIARLLNLSPKTVETQMGRALKVLRARLAPYVATLVLLLYAVAG